jgi:hypothetical protein
MNLKQRKLIKQALKKHACFVLITCDEPSEDGKMSVEMIYEGDAALASYLVQGAQIKLNEEDDEDICSHGKVLPING